MVSRRAMLAGALTGAAAGLVLLPLGGAARAAGLGASLSGLLGKASDSTLDRLSQPGAYYNDKSIRIVLPLFGSTGRLLGRVLKTGDRLGLTNNLTRALNDAAGLAAKEAKPVFRSAISQLSLADVPGIATQNDGATQYLKRTSGTELQTRLRPLIDTALGQVGAFNQLDALGQRVPLLAGAGLTRDRLGASVTEQALSGIFKYLGVEEAKLRADPLGGLLGSVLRN